MFHYLANPGMPPVGVLKFSKRHILKQIDPTYVPETKLLRASMPWSHIEKLAEQIGFPCIIKPDVGERGTDVAKIDSLEELTDYLHDAGSEIYLLQSFVDLPHEFGVMYYRLPDQTQGTVTGIVQKIPLTVTGDGRSTLSELISRNERTARYIPIFHALHRQERDRTVPTDETVQLTHIGNHCKGSKFLDRSDLIDDELIACFDHLAKQIDGFYYGRFDVKVQTPADLSTGNQLMIIEVNGVQSEPAHIYDPDYPLPQAYHQLFHHWYTVYKISRYNTKRKGISSRKFGSTLKHLRDKATRTTSYQVKTSELARDSALLQRTAGHITKHLDDCLNQRRPVTQHISPAQLQQKINFTLPEHPATSREIDTLIKQVLDYSVATSHQGFHNQLFSSADPHGIAADRITSVLNPSVYTYEMSPVFTLMEQAFYQQIASMLGRDQTHLQGFFLPGGSMSNQYALLFARYAAHPEANQDGLYDQRKMIVFSSDQGHYSISKGAALIGIGKEQIVTIPTDQRGTMRPDALEQAVQKHLDLGDLPIMINATAGSTVLGAFDPIAEIRHIARRHNIWLHVDGALGGSALFSDHTRELLDGVEKVDSFSLNFHKTLGAPLQCSLLITKHPKLAASCNKIYADYLFQNTTPNSALDCGDLYIQCGRKADILKAWMIRQAYGRTGLQARIDQQRLHADYLYQLLSDDARFLVYPTTPQWTNVCFRYLPSELRGQIHTVDDLSTHAEQITATTNALREQLLTEGNHMINTQPIKGLPDGFRMVTINPHIDQSYLEQLHDTIARLGQTIDQSSHPQTSRGLLPSSHQIDIHASKPNH